MSTRPGPPHRGASARPRRVGGADPRTSRWLHRQGDLSGKPGADRRQHPPGRARSPCGAVREGAALLQGLRSAALRAQARRLLSGPTPARLPPSTARHRHAGRGPRHSGAYESAGSASTKPSPRRSSPRSPPAGLQAAWQRPSRWRTNTTPRWPSGGMRSNAPSTRPPAPSGATSPSTPSTGWSPAASNPTGNNALQARQRRGRLSRRDASGPNADRREREPHTRAGRRPRTRVDGANHNRPRPQAAAAHPARGGDHPRRPYAKRAELTLRWRGGALTELAVALPRQPQPDPHRRGHDRAAPRLAVHYPDATIAGILNRQGRTAPRGERIHRLHRRSLRTHWRIAAHQPLAAPPEGELVRVTEAARQLGVAPSTVHRWLNDGFLAGEQPTPGAPWRIRLTEELRARFVEHAPDGPPMREAKGTRRLPAIVLQRVKRGELEAIHVRAGRRKGLRIRVPAPADGLF